MKKPEAYEKYPISTVLLFNLVSLLLYFSGLYLLYLIWPVFSVLFLIYVLYLESSVWREGCVSCYYYGKRCASGKGKIAKLFFKKGDPKKFTERSVSFKDFIPSFMVNVIIIIAGVYLLLQSFNWLVLGLTAWPIIAFLSNQVTFGELGCPHCKQARIGCPACEYFMAKAKKKN